VKYTGLLIAIGGVAVFLSFRFLKQVRVRPSGLGPVSEQWLFEKRRHLDDQ
jgi:hypothetical protein